MPASSGEAKAVFGLPEALSERVTHYCPGCTHGVIHRLVAEVLDELSLRKSAVGMAPVGCAVLAYDYFACDMIQCSHGRAPAVATGIKRGRPDLTVFTYQGDGDLASIGMAEIIHAANRGEKITVVFVNNAIYGMTAGQMAPTTLPRQVTTTTPEGRDPDLCGHPIRVAELISALRTPAFVARGAVHVPGEIVRTKELLRRAFRYQSEKTCFSLVEILSTCPTNWGLPADEALRWVQQNMVPYYPLGVFKEPGGIDRAPKPL
jgi:2-oxoglutarate ferredoxin oxidoreductase subunit beta